MVNSGEEKNQPADITGFSWEEMHPEQLALTAMKLRIPLRRGKYFTPRPVTP